MFPSFCVTKVWRHTVQILPCFFARPLIYSICISVLLFPYCEGRFLDMILLVHGFCSILYNGFGSHMVCAVQLFFGAFEDAFHC